MFKVLITKQESVFTAKLFRQLNSSPETVKLTESVFHSLFRQAISDGSEVKETFLFVGPDLSRDECSERIVTNKFQCKFVKERKLDTKNVGAVKSYFMKDKPLGDYVRIESNGFSIYLNSDDEYLVRLKKHYKSSKRESFLLMIEASDLVSEFCSEMDAIENENPRRKRSLDVSMEGALEYEFVARYIREKKEENISGIKWIDDDFLGLPVPKFAALEDKHDQPPDLKPLRILTQGEILDEARDVIEECVNSYMKNLKRVCFKYNIPFSEDVPVYSYKNETCGKRSDMIKQTKIKEVRFVNIRDGIRKSYQRKYILWLNGDRPEWNYFLKGKFIDFKDQHCDIDFNLEENTLYDTNVY